jgi:2-isopropylmalate synthase
MGTITYNYPEDPDVAALWRIHPHGAAHLAGRLDARARRELRDLIQHLEALNPGVRFFEVEHFEVSTRMTRTRSTESAASVRISIQGNEYAATARGQGSINALDVCLRQCLSERYPAIAQVKLTDYQVRIIDAREGTAGRAHVLVGWSDERRRWVTAGISDNVIHASWLAMVDAIKLELMRLAEHDATVEKIIEEYCWGV